MVRPHSDPDDSPEGVFAAAPDRVAALVDWGTSEDGFSDSSQSDSRSDSSSGSAASTGGVAPDVPGYDIIARLGEGAMGTVWRAVQRSTRREVALKLIAQGVVGSQRARLRFDREVELAARLEHPHVARVYDSGVSRGVYYYAMELVEGRHLDRYVSDEKLDTRQTLALMKDVCLAVQHAHQRGVIHRDLKPSNILVTNEGVPKVLDFGLAKALDEAQDGDNSLTLTQDGQFAGTPAFMSPEQAAGDGSRIDTRADVYGLGATLYLLLTGQTPHDTSGARLDVLRRVVEGAVRPPRRLRYDLDADLSCLLLKCLEQDPIRRYQSAADLAADIAAYLAGEPLAARPAALLYRLRKRVRKHLLAVSLATAAAAMVLITVIASYARVVAHATEESRLRGETQVTLANAILAQGDSLAALNRWRQAGERYAECYQMLRSRGQSLLPVELAIWDLNRRSPAALLELDAHAGAVADVAFLPDGNRFVSGGSEDGVLKVWECRTARLLRAISTGGKIRRFSVSPDGRVVAAATTAGVALWRLDDGTPSGRMTDYAGEASAVAISPDGTRLLVGTTDEDENLCLFDLANGRKLLTFRGHQNAVRAVAFSPDGRVAVSSAGRAAGDSHSFNLDASVRAWEVVTTKELWTATADPKSRLCGNLTVTPDGRSVVTTSWDGVARVWDADNGSLKSSHSYGRSADVQGVAVAPDGLLLATGAEEGAIHLLWSEPAEHELFVGLGGHPGGTRSVAFSPDGRFLVSGGADGAVRLWPIFARPGGGTLPTEEPFVEVHFTSVSPDGRLAVASTVRDKRVRVWDVISGLPLCTLFTQAGAWQSAAFFPDSRRLLVVEEGGRLAVWDPIENRRLRAFDPPASKDVPSVALSADGRVAAAVARDSGHLVVFDADAGAIVERVKFDTFVESDCRIVFSRNDRFAAGVEAYNGNGRLVVWDLPGWRERYSVPVPYVSRVDVSADSKLIAVTGQDVRVFEAATGTMLRQLPEPVDLSWAVCFMPDGRHVLAGGWNGFGLWNITDGVRVRSLGADYFTFDVALSGSRLLWAQRGQRSPNAVNWTDLNWAGEYQQFYAELKAVRQRLGATGKVDAAAFRAFSRWYAFRGVWDWACDMDDGAVAAGARVDPVERAVHLVKAGRAAQARAVVARALQSGAPRTVEIEALKAGLAGTPANVSLAVDDERCDVYLKRAVWGELQRTLNTAERDRLLSAAATLRPGRMVAMGIAMVQRKDTVVEPEPTAPAGVPGRVEAEAYDSGGEGVGYHDVGPQQTGTFNEIYRSGGVDIDVCEDEGGGLNVGGIFPGEWLAYTVKAKGGGEYQLDIRLSALAAGGKVRIQIDGEEVPGAVDVPETMDWQRWQTVTKSRIRLTEGRHRLRFTFEGSTDVGCVCNFNWFELRKDSDVTPARR